MEAEDIDRLAPAYDRAFNSWDIDSPVVKEAKAGFWRILEACYERDCPDGKPAFDEYRRKAVARCKRWLAKGN